MRPSPGRLACLIAGILVLSGCRVDTTVRVDVTDDGSGQVVVVIELDAEAVQAAEAGGGMLEQRVPLSDLGDAGWRVGKWERADDGSARLTVTRKFANPDEVSGIIAEISGPAEPLQLTLTRDESFYAKEFELKGEADLTEITAVTGDRELLDRLTAEDVDVAALEQRLRTELDESYRLRVAARLPGAGTKEWEVAPGERVEIDASSTSRPVLKGFLLIAGVGLAVLAALL
ncbi:MAG: hypothetical protein ACRDWD_07255, partial [Acidimicrobiia bacterium]